MIGKVYEVKAVPEQSIISSAHDGVGGDNRFTLQWLWDGPFTIFHSRSIWNHESSGILMRLHGLGIGPEQGKAI